MMRTISIACLLLAFLQIPNCRKGAAHDKWEYVKVEPTAFQNTYSILIVRMEFPPGSKYARRIAVWPRFVGNHPSGRGAAVSIPKQDQELEALWVGASEEIVALDEDNVLNAAGASIAKFQGLEILQATKEFFVGTEVRPTQHSNFPIVTMKPVKRFSTISEIYHAQEQQAVTPNQADATVGATTPPGHVQALQQNLQAIQQGMDDLSATPSPSAGTTPSRPRFRSLGGGEASTDPQLAQGPNLPTGETQQALGNSAAPGGSGSDASSPLPPPRRLGDRAGNVFIYAPVDWNLEEGDDVLILNGPQVPGGEAARIEVDTQLMDTPMDATQAAQALLQTIQGALPGAMASQPRPFQLGANSGSRFEFTLADDPASRRFQVYCFTKGNLLYIVRASTNARSSPADRRAIEQAINSLELP